MTETMTRQLGHAPRVQTTEVDGSLILADPENGLYFGLNGPATAIWRMVAEGKTGRSIATELASLYQVDESVTTADTEALLADLLASQLVV